MGLMGCLVGIKTESIHARRAVVEKRMFEVT